jgi:hypothetical protein
MLVQAIITRLSKEDFEGAMILDAVPKFEKDLVKLFSAMTGEGPAYVPWLMVLDHRLRETWQTIARDRALCKA